jgi:hypothetical protein
MNVRMWVAVPVAIGVLFLSIWLSTPSLVIQFAGIAGVALFFSVRLISDIQIRIGKVRWVGHLVALGMLHFLLGLVAYYVQPFGYQTARSIYEELFDVSFWVFPVIFMMTWGLISVLILVYDRAIVYSDSVRALRVLAIGICAVVATFTAGAFNLIPAATQMFTSYGVYLPELSRLVIQFNNLWLAILALNIVMTGVVVVSAERWRKPARLAFGSLIGLLALANLYLFTSLGALFLPYLTLCNSAWGETGFTRLHAAAALGRTDSVLRLIENGTPIDIADNDGFTPLDFAVSQSHPAVVRVLLDKGANVNPHADNTGRTSPLKDAVSQGNIELASWLLEKGARVNFAGGSGRRPLHSAAVLGNLAMATLLLENGADINAVDELGKTPLDIASESKKGFLVVQLLIERGALRSTEESRRLRAVHPEPQSDLVKSSGSCVQ